MGATMRWEDGLAIHVIVLSGPGTRSVLTRMYRSVRSPAPEVKMSRLLGSSVRTFAASTLESKALTPVIVSCPGRMSAYVLRNLIASTTWVPGIARGSARWAGDDLVRSEKAAAHRDGAMSSRVMERTCKEEGWKGRWVG